MEFKAEASTWEGLSDFYREMFEAVKPLLETMNELQKEYRRQYYKPFIDDYRAKVERAIAQSGLSHSTYAARERNKAEDYINRLLAGQPSTVSLASTVAPMINQAALELLRDRLKQQWWSRYRNWYRTKAFFDRAMRNADRAAMTDYLATLASVSGPSNSLYSPIGGSTLSGNPPIGSPIESLDMGVPPQFPQLPADSAPQQFPYWGIGEPLGNFGGVGEY